MTRLLAALLLAVALAPAAGAAEPWEAFFELSLGDLRSEAAEARKAGKQGLMVMYHFEACPACARMKREVLSRPAVQQAYRARFRPIAIDTLGALEVTGFDGRAMPEKAYAQAAGIRGTPTFDFIDPDGRLLARHVGGIFNPADFILLADFVASGAHRNTSFGAWLQAQRRKGG